MLPAVWQGALHNRHHFGCLRLGQLQSCARKVGLPVNSLSVSQNLSLVLATLFETVRARCGLISKQSEMRFQF